MFENKNTKLENSDLRGLTDLGSERGRQEGQGLETAPHWCTFVIFFNEF